MKIHMVSKGGLSKLHVCPQRGEGGVKNTQKSIHMVYGCSLVLMVVMVASDCNHYVSGLINK